MNANDRIRLMRLEDIDRVLEIETLCFQTPWSKESFERELNVNQAARYLVLEHEGDVVAYAGIWLVLSEGHITNVAVHPNFRGLGLGKAIVANLLKLACCYGVTEATLEVRPSNEAALNLYRGFGFYPTGVRKGYYTDTQEDALLMWKYDVGSIQVSEEECACVYRIRYES